ncbi:MAG: Lrp/AsnC ligand binding domain-containing protein [Deltaproteobacteria bacterium]|nr:Lrp/AsnC ligand binding domain-containing protein [Deltaproteobacteria bacterium]
MAVDAYIFIECEHGKALEVVSRVKDIGGVKDVKAVTGPYDVIALVSASNVDVLGGVVIGKIQRVGGVKRTLTNIVVESE